MFGSITCLREFSGRAGFTLYITLPLRRLSSEPDPCRFGFFHIIGPVFLPEMITGYFNFGVSLCLPYSWPFYTYPSITLPLSLSREFLPHRPSSGSLAYASRATGMVLPSWVMYVVYRVNRASYSLGSHLAIMFGSITCLREFSGRAGFTPIYYPSTSASQLRAWPLSFRVFPYYWTRLFTRNDNRLFQLRRLTLPPVFLTLLYLP